MKSFTLTVASTDYTSDTILEEDSSDHVSGWLRVEWKLQNNTFIEKQKKLNEECNKII